MDRDDAEYMIVSAIISLAQYVVWMLIRAATRPADPAAEPLSDLPDWNEPDAFRGYPRLMRVATAAREAARVGNAQEALKGVQFAAVLSQDQTAQRVARTVRNAYRIDPQVAQAVIDATTEALEIDGQPQISQMTQMTDDDEYGTTA